MYTLVTSVLVLAAFGNLYADPVPETPSTLKSVHIAFRHGDRATVSLYPNDPNKDYIYPFGNGQLTLIGKQQQYELGTFLRTRYGNFFSTDPREIEVRSSDKDRCIASTQINLAAFFKPEGKYIWNPDLLWQPVPIHTNNKESDFLLNEDADCPAGVREAAKLPTTPQGIAFVDKYKTIMDYYTEHSGLNVHDPSSVLDIYGTLNIEKMKNLIIPDWVDLHWAELKQAANEAFVTKYTSKLTQRLKGGELLGYMTKLMKQRATATVESNPKGYMYSTHDAILAALTSAMGVFNGLTVPYCATLLLELHQAPGANATVRTFWRNTTEHEPFQLQIPGCELDCPLTQFETLLTDVIPVNIYAECHAPAVE